VSHDSDPASGQGGRYLILGGGGVTAEYYLPALRLLGALGRVTVVDPSQASLDLLAARYPGLAARLGGHEAGLEADAAERVIVAAPNALHLPAARLALESGRHVLCEKPLALTEAACAELARAARNHQRLLKVAMSRRYLPSWRLAREIVARRELGEVRAIEVSDCAPFGWRPRSFAFFAPDAGGVLADMGVHYLDYLETLVGPMRPLAYDDDARGGVESNLEFRLQAESGAPVELRLSRTRRGATLVRIRCEAGEIRIDKQNQREVVVAAAGSPGRRVSSLQPFRNGAGHWPTSFIGSFCDMLADFENAQQGLPSDIADVEDARRAAGLIEWAYARRRRPSRPVATPAQGDGADVLITGATGFIGSHLLDRLDETGAAVRITARRPDTLANAARYGVQVAPGGVLSADAMRSAARGVRTLFHLAVDSGSADARRVTVEGTRNVVEAAIEAGAECVVVLSTLYVFGFPGADGLVDETFPYRPYGGAYARSKAVMERWCLQRAESSGPTRIVVLNPACVFGPGGGAYATTPFELAEAGAFGWIDGGAGVCNYNYVDNLVDAMQLAAEVPEAHGERFIISDGAVSWREFLGPLLGASADTFPSYSARQLQALNQRRERFEPVALARAIIAAPQVREAARKSGVIRAASRLLRVADRPACVPADSRAPVCAAPMSPLPPAWIASLYGPAKTRFSSAKAEAMLGWRPRVQLAEAQRLTRAWLHENLSSA
jgi:predicted dehydrogenase/nucleoside-diphosphate-sugar epimerase